MAQNKALWGGRFEDEVAWDMRVYGDSLPVDERLWPEDIYASMAHASMLAEQGIISEEDAESIRTGLANIANAIEQGSFEPSEEAEDIHMALELELTRLVGAAGKRLHTARSRNDQVACDFRLYCKSAAAELAEELKDARRDIIEVAEAHLDTILPGYTHLQKAQPIVLAHHLLAWEAMLARDTQRFEYAQQAADASPLGAAALAGTPHPIDRAKTAELLEFSRVITNSLDAVADRDFACDFMYAAAMTMQHLSRISEELILWSSDEFGFIRLADAYSTGSSIMPQKRNPDFAELTRGKTGRVYGDLFALLTTLKALPLAYNKDLQEDKEGLFDAHDTLVMALGAVRGMVCTLTVNKERMLAAASGGFMAATDLADWLAAHGVPFREAHEIVGRVVLAADKAAKRLDELTLKELQELSAHFTEEALGVTAIAAVVAARTSKGGTAPSQVALELAAAKTRLNL